jgi:hypothetical protein
VGRDSCRPGQEVVLERRAVGDRRVRGGDPRRVVNLVEPLLDRDRQYLASPAASSTTVMRLVFASEARMVSLSSGRIVCRSITSAEIPSAASASAACSESSTPFIALTSVMSLPSRAIVACPIPAGAGVSSAPFFV